MLKIKFDIKFVHSAYIILYAAIRFGFAPGGFSSTEMPRWGTIPEPSEPKSDALPIELQGSYYCGFCAITFKYRSGHCGLDLAYVESGASLWTLTNPHWSSVHRICVSVYRK